MHLIRERFIHLWGKIPYSRIILKFIVIAVPAVLLVAISLLYFTYQHAQNNYTDQIELTFTQQSSLLESLISEESTRLLAFGELWSNYIQEAKQGNLTWAYYRTSLMGFVNALPPDAFIDQVVFIDKDFEPHSFFGSEFIDSESIAEQIRSSTTLITPKSGVYCNSNCYIYALIPQPLGGVLFLRSEFSNTLLSFSDLSNATIAQAVVISSNESTPAVITSNQRFLNGQKLFITQLTDYEEFIGILHDVDQESKDWLEVARQNRHGFEFEYLDQVYSLQAIDYNQSGSFYFLIIKDVTELHEKNTQSIFLQGWIAALLLFLIVLLFSLFVARLSQRIKQLSGFIPVIGQGEFKYVIDNLKPREVKPVVLDEIDELLESTLDSAHQLEIAVKLREDATEKDRIKNQYLSKINHEIRTLMTPIIGYSTLADENMEHGKLARILKKIGTSAEMLKRLSSLVMDVAKVDSGKVDIANNQINIFSFIPNTVSMITEQAEKKNLRLSVVMFDDIPAWIESDATLLQHIILNLVQNAIKYTDYGHVRIVIKRKNIESMPVDHMALDISVIDDGIGINKRSVKNINDFLYQVHHERGGYGVGLYITQTFVKALGGNINVSSIEGEGSHFNALIPVSSLKGRLIDRAWTSPPSILVVSSDQAIKVSAYEFFSERQKIFVAAPELLPSLDTRFDAIILASALDQVVVEYVYHQLLVPDGTVVIHEQSKEQELIAQIATGLVIYRQPKLTPESMALSISFINNRQSMVHLSESKQQQTDNPLRVLIAEDDYSIREFIAELLNDRGHSVVTTDNGIEALNLLKNDHFDSALIDVNMPGISGFEVMTQYRELHPYKANCRCIAMSADDKPFTQTELSKYGADGFITKPFDNENLYQIIENHQEQLIYSSTLSTETKPQGPGSHIVDRTLIQTKKIKNVKLFLEQARDDIEELRRSARMDQHEEFWANAHRLKGSTAFFGFTALNNYLKKLLNDRPDENLEDLSNVAAQLFNVSENLVRNTIPLGARGAA